MLVERKVSEGARKSWGAGALEVYYLAQELQ